jgi:hypothetical protein
MHAQGPTSETDLARGGIQPSSEADLARGGVQSPSEADLARGWRLAFRSGGPRGPPGVWLFSTCVFRLVDEFTFCVFYEMMWVFPGCLGDPWGCPRQ